MHENTSSLRTPHRLADRSTPRSGGQRCPLSLRWLTPTSLVTDTAAARRKPDARSGNPLAMLANAYGRACSYRGTSHGAELASRCKRSLSSAWRKLIISCRKATDMNTNCLGRSGAYANFLHSNASVQICWPRAWCSNQPVCPSPKCPPTGIEISESAH
jgi:hypothetical protein